MCYITLEKDDEKMICKLFEEPAETEMVMEYLVLQRLAVYILVHVLKSREKKKQNLLGLWELVVNTFKVHSVMTDLILETLLQMNRISKNSYRIKEMGKQKKVRQILKFMAAIKKKVHEM